MSGSRIVLSCGQHVDVSLYPLDVYDVIVTLRDEGVGLDEGFLVIGDVIVRAAAVEAVVPR